MKTNKFSIICHNLDETDKLAKNFAFCIKNGCFVSLFGDIGAGKTVFVKSFTKYMEVKEKVTSPSFTILNEYLSGKKPIYHFDLYRLENIGIKTITEELREYSEGNFITFVEWADFSQGEIPFNKIEIKITYDDNENRKFEFLSFGDENYEIIERLKSC